jgi:hypothetical protein
LRSTISVHEVRRTCIAASWPDPRAPADAFEQDLGLKLETTRARVEELIIGRIERLIEN